MSAIEPEISVSPQLRQKVSFILELETQNPEVTLQHGSNGITTLFVETKRSLIKFTRDAFNGIYAMTMLDGETLTPKLIMSYDRDSARISRKGGLAQRLKLKDPITSDMIFASINIFSAIDEHLREIDFRQKLIVPPGPDHKRFSYPNEATILHLVGAKAGEGAAFYQEPSNDSVALRVTILQPDYREITLTNLHAGGFAISTHDLRRHTHRVTSIDATGRLAQTWTSRNGQPAPAIPANTDFVGAIKYMLRAAGETVAIEKAEQRPPNDQPQRPARDPDHAAAFAAIKRHGQEPA